MPEHNWTCLACDKSVSAENTECLDCGCPMDISGHELDLFKKGKITKFRPASELADAKDGRRADGSNIIPHSELFESVVSSLMFIFLAWYFLKEEKAIISFPKDSGTVIEIRGVYPSIFAAIALILLATVMASVIFDHFDRRNNEHIYKAISSWLSRLSLISIIVCTFIGWLTGNIHVVNT